MAKKSDIPDGLKDAFKTLDKMNPYSSILSENCISVVTDYIDTGSMALNAIISGSTFGGVPKGKLIGFVGPTGSGKTLILNKIIGNAQKKDPDVWGVVWDTENAYDPRMVSNVGGNPDRIKVNPVGTVEDCRNQISTFLDKIIADPSLHGKIIIAIDSLGNLSSAKEIADAEKGKDAVDMGMRAKALKSMMRVLTYKCALANVTILFANHTYADPTAMYPSMFQNQSGGSGSQYISHVIVQLSVTQEKAEAGDGDSMGGSSKIKGVNLRALTVKNRVIPHGKTTSLYLNFLNGLYKYSGIIDLAEDLGVVTKQGNTYYLGEEKLGMRNSFKDDDSKWDKIIESLNSVMKDKWMYSSEADKLKAEVERLSDVELGDVDDND